jgi:hypothetical protein
MLHPQVESIMQIHVPKQPRNDSPLGSSFFAGLPLVRLHDACLQPFADQAHKTPITDPVLEELQHPPVVDGIEEPTDVRIQHPVPLPRPQRHCQRIQRLVGSASRPESV